MPERRRLGTVYVKSPAQLTGKWIVDNSSKMIFSVIYCIIWLAICFVLAGVINFLGSELTGMWDTGIPTMTIYNHPYAIPVKVFGMLCIIIFIFRDSRTK